MSTTVDQRVVEMRFDNKQFESNVSTTMSTLDKLKQSLNLTGASKGLENVSSAAKGCDMSALNSAVDSVKSKFSALEVMGVTALVNITNSAVNAGKRIVSALTIDPVKMGFSEYETQINAVQTILANTESKGKTLEDVNTALDELNTYADKTIYNFTEMTRNIGTFTAAGVDLDTSVSAIKGIANLAAVSGSTSQQASTAMYQLSQAMASGTVKLMDWNSVVNAGMGGQVFQDALKETAKVHGVAIDDIINKQGSFRESLSEGWLTTEILTETLSKFTGDLTEEQLKSMGYTEEQIEGIMKMGKTANDAATKVKTFSQLFDTLKEAAQSGWTQTWEIIVGDFEEAKAFLTEVSDTLGAMIGSSAEARNELLENWKVLGGRTALIDGIKNAFVAIGSVIKPIKEAFREIFPPMTAERLVAITEGFKNLMANLKLSDAASENLKRTFKGVFAILDIGWQLISATFKAVGSLFGGIGSLSGGILGITASFGDWLVNLSETIRSCDIFNRVLQGIADVIKVVLKVGTGLIKFVGDKFVSPGLELLGSLLERIRERFSFIGDAAGTMKSVVIDAFDSIGSFLEGCSFFKLLEALWKGIKIIASGIAKAFGALTSGLAQAIGATDFNGILDIVNSFIAGGVGVGLIKFIKSLREPFESIGGFMDNIKDVLDGVRGCFEAYQTQLKAGALMKIATAIAILAGSLFVLSLINSDKMATAIGGITTLFVELMGAMAVIGKMDKGGGWIKATIAMYGISSALLVLAVAMKILSTMSYEETVSGLVAVAGGLGALVAAIHLLPEKKVNSAASSIKKMSTALLILAVAMKIMSSMSWQEMSVGLVTMIVSLGALVGAVNLLPEGKVTNAAKAISKMSKALFILALAIKIMSTMSWMEMAVGLTTMVAGLGVLIGALYLLPKDVGLKAVGMISLATAMVVLAAALQIMSSMSWQELGIGLAALAGSLLILVVAMNAMQSALPGAAAMLIAAGALSVLTPVLLILGMMSWESIVKGLVAIAGAFTILGIAGYVLTPVTPIILALGAALLLIGAGTLAAATGLLLLGAALTSLAVGFTAILGSLSAIVTGIIALVAAVITGIIKGIGDGIVALCKVITAAAPAICDAFVAVINSVCKAIIETMPTIMAAVGSILDGLIDLLLTYVPKLVDTGMKLIIGLLDGIAANLPDIIQAGVDIIVAFIRGIGKAVPQIVDAGMKMIADLLNGMAKAIRDNTDIVINAMNNLLEAVIEAIGKFLGNFVEIGKMIIKGLIKGVASMAKKLWDSVVGVVKDAWNGVKDFLGIKSPSRLAAEAGMYIDEGLAVGLKKYADVAGDAAVGVGESTMDSLKDTFGGISDVLNSDVDMQPTIRPVLDLSDVKSGAGAIDSMLGMGSSIGVTANVGAINSMMKNQNGGNDDLLAAINKLRKDIGNTKTETYNINGITYDDGSNIANAVKSIVKAARVERRAY